MDTTADSFPTSTHQEALWLAEPEGPTARTQAHLELTGPLDGGALEAALATLVARHEILRTTFVRQPGIRVPLQLVNDSIDPLWTTVDLQGTGPEEQARRLRELSAAELAAPLDYEHGPLLRAVAATLSADRRAVVLTIAGLCADACSAALLAGELTAACGDGAELTDEPLQYADFAAWQREFVEAEGDEGRSAADFWAGWHGAASPELPFARPAAGSFAPEEVTVDLGPELARRLRQQASRYDASVSALTQAAWHALLGRISGDESVVVSYVASERRHADLDGAIGVFSRHVPIRTEVTGTVTFAALLHAVARSREQALIWQDYAPAAGPELTIGFRAQNDLDPVPGPLGASLERIGTCDDRLSLWLSCQEGREDVRLRLGFDARFLDRQHVERMARELAQLLRGVAVDAGTTIGELSILDADERRLVLADFNASDAPRPELCVHELFAQTAAAHPTRSAVVDEHGALSYADLDARANQLAQRLSRAGIGPDVPVGLCTDRSTDMIVGLLGILKAGGAYLPLHSAHPPARLAHQIQMAGARAIVTQEQLLARLPTFDGELICLDRDRAALDAEPTTAPAPPMSPDRLVYVIYTSGSTGTPKGVGVTHGSLSNYASFIAGRVGADGQPLTFGVVTSISTDLGNTAIFGSLCSGGTLVLIGPTVASDAGALAAQFAQTPVDVLKITPSHVGALLAGGDPAVLPRRWLVIGGERAPWDLVERVRAASGSVGILNHYGPTEATVGCCTFEVGEGPGPYAPASVPIGRPIANSACYVVDERQQPVPIGVRGRLFISGAGVARGYVGAPDLTDERFVADPFRAGRTMYDTGDLARWLPDGNLEFMGRVDEQVKIRGYRVEPAEVETALRAHAGVREAVVVAQTSAAGDARLVAYCVGECDLNGPVLRAHLEAWVPEFMLPSAIVILDALPVTPSGKIDRLALPDPGSGVPAANDSVAPRTPMEAAVGAIWSRVLGVEHVGIHDDFFALGGHSLLATQVVAHVRSDFAVDLPLHSLFSYPTVESLTAEIVRMIGDSDHDETAQLLAELESLSDEDAERLLAGDESEQV